MAVKEKVYKYGNIIQDCTMLIALQHFKLIGSVLKRWFSYFNL